MSGRRCVITGAADGIGRALAIRFGQAGYSILGIDVDRDRALHTQALLSAGQIECQFLITDLGRLSCCEMVGHLLQEGPPIDVLIHSAGISAVGPFAGSQLDRQQAVLDLNLRAPLIMTPALLRGGKLRVGGSLVFIASLSHFTGYPGAAVYAAGKDGIVSYARSLRAQLSRQQRHVLTVFPGPTRTAHARRYSPDNRREARRMPPEVLADAVYEAVRRRRSMLIPGGRNRMTALAGRLAPRLMEQIMRKIILDRLPADSGILPR